MADEKADSKEIMIPRTIPLTNGFNYNVNSLLGHVTLTEEGLEFVRRHLEKGVRLRLGVSLRLQENGPSEIVALDFGLFAWGRV